MRCSLGLKGVGGATFLTAVVLFCLSPTASAATLYVDVNGTNATLPYTNWLTAATNIQDAVDAAVDGDSILVTNGVYASGGLLYGMTNRVAVTKPVTVQSVNGPEVTTIVGYQVPTTRYGTAAIRCVYLTNGAALTGFTLTNGATASSRSGGGVYCESASAVVSNCVIAGNAAASSGGGAYSGTLFNCTLSGNSGTGGGAYGSTLNNCTLTGNWGGNGGGANNCTLNNCALFGNSAYGASGGSGGDGGGAYNSTLRNCTVIGNAAYFYSLPQGVLGPGHGGGTYGGTLYNCILYYNSSFGGNYFSGTLNYCCTTPLPTSGTGNTNVEPQLASLFHLSASSPCRGAGNSAYATGVDVDGEPWARPPSIGCDEYWTGAVTGALTVAIVASPIYTTAGSNVTFQAAINGRLTASVWDFGNGILLTNRPFATNSWAMVGDYTVSLRACNDSYPDGVATNITIHVVGAHYVALENQSPAWPYSSWATAATNIQDAVDAAAGLAKSVLVSNGVYRVGLKVVDGMSNRVAVTTPMTVRSVNGPEATWIQGNGLYGPEALRCVYLTSNTVLCGFTLTNGATRTSGAANDRYGGGVWCASTSAVVTNCVLVGNSAHSAGGGAYGGGLYDCILCGNWCASSGGGASGSTLYRCTISNNVAGTGGGLSSCSANVCTVTGNSGTSYGGGAYLSTLKNCAIALNSAPAGGGSYLGTLTNCTVTGNRAAYAGGAKGGTLYNCVLYYNTSASSNNFGPDVTLNYCCTTPLPPSGSGNLALEPQLASLSHLSAVSPCFHKGRYASTTATDIDGESWASVPSIGCDEFWSGAVTGALTVAIQADYTNAVAGAAVPLVGLISGRVTASCWDFGDGLVVSNRPYASHAWATTGDYPVSLRAYNATYPAGVSTMVTVHVVSQAVHYVSLSSAASAAPYDSWETAATNIQDAVDAATAAGALVVVSNGVYQAGGRVVYGTSSNRVAVTKPLTVQSLNGPAVTAIVGYSLPGTTNGDGAVRCAYLASGATLTGFTLTNGATRAYGDSNAEMSGGGAWCESSSAVLSNCVVTGNAASAYGGGAIGGTLLNCTLSANWAKTFGGGAYGSVLTNCAVSANAATNGAGVSYAVVYNSVLSGNSANSGGGAHYSALTNCTLAGNVATFGGGAYYGTLDTCGLTNNAASQQGGGAYQSTLQSCALNGNSAQSGGGAYSATLANCLLSGNSATNGGGAYAGQLYNCALTGNTAMSSGGGTWCCAVTNSSLTGNSAVRGGGCYQDAAYRGALVGCTLSGNRASEDGGGTWLGSLYNCTITGNSALNGGGAASSKLVGCILYYNQAQAAATANYTSDSSLYCCCTTPLPAGGTDNVEFDPQLASTSHLSANSPCISRDRLCPPSGVDIDGERWLTPASIGCDEFYGGSSTGSLAVAIQADYLTVAPACAVNLQALIDGRTIGSVWDFGDGTVLSNSPVASHRWSVPGEYAVVLRAYNLTYPAGVAATATVQVVSQPVHYVVLSNAAAAFPYGSWATAAPTIQEAVDAASVPGALVLVSNGVYQTGGCVIDGAMSNRVAVTKPLVLRSLNGPGVTAIRGSQVAGSVTGDAAVRCVYLTNGAVLAGFTITNGATRATGNAYKEQYGAGVWCQSTGATVSNCVIVGNAAAAPGGGIAGGTVSDCTFTSNSATWGGGAWGAVLRSCSLSSNTAWLGGGVHSSTLTDCILTANPAQSDGGGAHSSLLNHCILSGNSGASGGGAYGGTLNACLLQGNRGTSGGGANSSSLNNCTLSGNSASQDGGGVCNGTCNSCLFTNNSAASGGGASHAALISCALQGNTVTNLGGGAWSGSLTNCTLIRNRASEGGGASASTLVNCISCYNLAPAGGNYSVDCTLSYCCTAPLPSAGLGNLQVEPQLAAFPHLSPASPCLGKGNSASISGTDFDGEPYANPPAIGCDEPSGGAITGALTVAILTDFTNVVPGFSLQAEAAIQGPFSASRWEFGDGTMASNLPCALHVWASTGDYPLVLRAFNSTYPGGVASTVTVHVVTQPVHYVALTSTNPSLPYNSWATAATNIQNAVDAASVAGALVLVSNGLYQTGGRVVAGALSNRLAITKPVRVQSLNGTGVTTIAGLRVAGSTNGDAAIRCAYVADGATLVGFTLTNGATRATGSDTRDLCGGGAWCESANATVSECCLIGNSAYKNGAGLYGGTGTNCTLTTNTAFNSGGAAYGGALSNCTVAGNAAAAAGGGICNGSLNSCTLVGNSTSSSSGGGGTYMAGLTNCLVKGNSAPYGGGVAWGSLDNCTLVGNDAHGWYNSAGGGAAWATLRNCRLSGNTAYSSAGASYGGTLINCTVVGNSAATTGGCVSSALTNSIVYYNTNGDISGGNLSYSCTTALAYGAGNLTNPPLFLSVTDGDLRLQPNSPCINAGFNAYAPGATDVDGNPRIVAGTVDIGAYECQSPALLDYYTWLQAYGLSTAASDLYTDSDGDCLDNWQEWLAGTVPTNAASVLQLLPPVINPPGLLLRWSSDANHTYFVQRASSLAPPLAFTTLRGDIPGLAGTTSYTDTRAISPEIAAFYRVGTGPTNAPAPILMQPPVLVPASATLTWLSVTNRSYYVERATDLASAPAFSLLQSNIPGLPGTTTFTDTNPPTAPAFYRVGVAP